MLSRIRRIALLGFCFWSIWGCATSDQSELAESADYESSQDGGEYSTPDGDDLHTDAEFRIRSEQIATKVKKLKKRVKRLKGKITYETTEGYGNELNFARITFRVPDKHFDEAVKFVRSLGDITYQSVTRASEDAEDYNDYSRGPRNRKKQGKTTKRRIDESKFSVTFDNTIRDEPDRVIGIHSSNLAVSGSNSGDKTRWGAGISLSHPRHFISLELNVYKPERDETSAASVTVGMASFSDRFNDGKNTFFNPYAGGRIGYISLDKHQDAMIGLDLGIELVKYHHFTLIVFARPYIRFSESGSEALIESGVGLGMPF